MGLAALIVVLAHSYAALPIPGWHYLIIRNPAMVIDFFALLSGFCGVCSLERRPDAAAFYLRRLRRMLPAYYAGAALYGLAGGITTDAMLAAHIVPLCVWTEATWSTFWYVPAALLYYALIPVAHRAMKDTRHPAAPEPFTDPALRNESSRESHDRNAVDREEYTYQQTQNDQSRDRSDQCVHQQYSPIADRRDLQDAFPAEPVRQQSGKGTDEQGHQGHQAGDRTCQCDIRVQCQ